jgi:hypothetical protein
MNISKPTSDICWMAFLNPAVSTAVAWKKMGFSAPPTQERQEWRMHDARHDLTHTRTQMCKHAHTRTRTHLTDRHKHTRHMRREHLRHAMPGQRLPLQLRRVHDDLHDSERLEVLAAVYERRRPVVRVRALPQAQHEPRRTGTARRMQGDNRDHSRRLAHNSETTVDTCRMGSTAPSS